MILLNRAHPFIADKHNTTKKRGNCFVRVSGKEIFFSSMACKLFELAVGDYVEFIMDGGQIFFAKTGDEIGFRLRKKDRTNLQVTNRPLVRQLLGDADILNYSLEKTGSDYGGAPLIKLSLYTI